MIWFTSDLHFCHDREFIYKPRGFNSIEEHDEKILQNFKDTIQNDDLLFILGDLMLNNNEKGIELINQIPGFKKIILGNHDSLKRIELYHKLYKTSILGYADILKYGKKFYYLSHYPTLVANENDKVIWCLHGHTHSKEKFSTAAACNYNVALDAHNNYPVSIDQINEEIRDTLAKNR